MCNAFYWPSVGAGIADMDLILSASACYIEVDQKALHLAKCPYSTVHIFNVPIKRERRRRIKLCIIVQDMQQTLNEYVNAMHCIPYMCTLCSTKSDLISMLCVS